MSVTLYNQDCKTVDISDKDNICIVTDPPFNIGYKYNTYKDNMKEDEYYNMLISILAGRASAVIHYPESLYKLAIKMANAPKRVVSWVYNSNTRRQHRDIAFFDVMPDFSKVKQPYKNPTDKRVKELIRQGREGTNLYDWFIVNQVKNVSKEKTEHPCQMPLDVMLKVVGIIPDEYTIYDPFMGSGTTGVACAMLGRDFIGCEMDEKYFQIAKSRIQNVTRRDES